MPTSPPRKLYPLAHSLLPPDRDLPAIDFQYLAKVYDAAHPRAKTRDHGISFVEFFCRSPKASGESQPCTVGENEPTAAVFRFVGSQEIFIVSMAGLRSGLGSLGFRGKFGAIYRTCGLFFIAAWRAIVPP